MGSQVSVEDPVSLKILVEPVKGGRCVLNTDIEIIHYKNTKTIKATLPWNFLFVRSAPIFTCFNGANRFVFAYIIFVVRVSII